MRAYANTGHSLAPRPCFFSSARSMASRKRGRSRRRPTLRRAGPRAEAEGRSGPPLLPTPPLTAAPTPEQDGNFVIGPPYEPAPELTVKAGVPQGTVREFTIDSKDSLIYPGIARNQPGSSCRTRGRRRLRARAARCRHTHRVHRCPGRPVRHLSQEPAADPRQPHSRKAGARDGRGDGPSTAAAMAPVANAAWSTTRSRGPTRPSSRRKCCRGITKDYGDRLHQRS